MLVSQKSQYALRAVFELAKLYDKGTVKIAQIAQAQSIPPRFLEVILSQLKQGGFVESRRGNEGGYMLIPEPAELTVGQVIEFIQGPVGPIDCMLENSKIPRCPQYGGCVFMDMWQQVRDAILSVYESITFADLVEQQKQMSQKYVASYCI